MALSIDATVGGANANSFVTLADADSYMESRLNGSTWDSAVDDDKNRALVEAQRELSVLGWKGQKASDAQALQWPRQWVEDPDASFPGFFYDTDEVPQRVKDAQMELAFQFIKSGTTDLAALPSTDGVVEKTIDVISTTYAEPSQRARGLARFPRIAALVAPLLTSAGSSFRLVRG